MCKIKSKKLKNGNLKNINGTGFFLRINMEDILFKKCLLTNNHVLNEKDIKVNKEIEIEYKNKPKIIEIKKNRKVYTNKDLDYTCIEILDTDNIEDYFKIDENIIEYSIEKYKNNEIFILQYPKGNKLSYSSGIILEIENNEIIHNSSTCEGSSGSPIILRNSNNSIIGLHYGSGENKKYNLSTNIISIINHIKNYANNNYIIAEIEIKEKNINEKIQIINSYEEVKRIYDCEDEEDEYKNEEEIKDNCEIKINNSIIPFSYYYVFEKKGKNKIEYKFKNKLSKTCYMFRDCSFLTNINLSNFNTQKVTNMSGMFRDCSSLIDINLSNFNTQKVTNMSGMFRNCLSLTNLNLSNFNTQNVTNMWGMFRNCSSLKRINLSNFKTKTDTYMCDMFNGCKSLKKKGIITSDKNILKELS